MRDWLTPEKSAIYNRILSNSYIEKNMNKDEIKKLIKEHVEKVADNSRKIYLLLLLAIWHEMFFEGRDNVLK